MIAQQKNPGVWPPGLFVNAREVLPSGQLNRIASELVGESGAHHVGGQFTGCQSGE